jgi:hypothetical protein
LVKSASATFDALGKQIELLAVDRNERAIHFAQSPSDGGSNHAAVVSYKDASAIQVEKL